MRRSPFKFLDAYQKDDFDIFFGRETETEDLYDALSGVKHLLVYGPSGAGKTSLIECGLRNQFSDADWFALTIRRGTNIIDSFYTAINTALEEKIPLNAQHLPEDETVSFEAAIEQLFAERYQPVYLLFDQFEELMISGTDNEQKAFFTQLNQLIRYRIPCRVLLIMREEFIGHLSEFEPLCPSIFKHLFRLEKMRRTDVQNVITKTLDAPQFTNDFTTENSNQLAQQILTKLPDKVKEIELTHVQVFLNELWERAIKKTADTVKPIIHSGLIEKEDNLQRILDSFLKKQLKELILSHGNQAPLEVLAAMISERHTKLQLTSQDINTVLIDNEVDLQKPLPILLEAFRQCKIIRELKSDEETTYEITHDILALAVGQNLTEEMQLREKAKEVVNVYEERTGYFSEEELIYLARFEGYYSKAFEDRITKSQQHRQSRKWKLYGIVASIIVVLATLLILSIYQANAATKLKTYIEDIGNSMVASQFLFEKGKTDFETHDFKNALVYFANTEFLKPNYDSIGIWIEYAKIGIEADNNYFSAYTEKAKLQYEKLKIFSSSNSSYYQKQIDNIDKSTKAVKKIIDDIGKPLHEIDSLDLVNQELYTLPDVFRDLKNLTVLYLANNNISDIHFLEKLTNLEKLDISINDISETDAKALQEKLPNCEIEY